MKGMVNFSLAKKEKINSIISDRISNNLVTEKEGYLLDATQGKILNEKKIDKNNISNSLLVEQEGYVLDARQGKILEDKINIINTPVCKNSANFLSSNSSIDSMIHSCKFYGKSIQSNTPTPDSPVEILDIANSGFLEINKLKKNLFNYTITSGYSIYGVTFTINNDKSITVNGTSTARPEVILGQVKLFAGRKYRFSANCNKDGSNKSVNYNQYMFLNNYNTTQFHNWMADTTFTVTEDCIVYCKFWCKSSQTISRTFYPMIQCIDNGEDLNFEYYENDIISVEADTLFGLPVLSGGNYTDSSGQQWLCNTIEYNPDGTGKYIKRIDKIIYDGENHKFNGKSTTSSNYLYYDNTIEIKKRSNREVLYPILSSHFIATSYNDTYQNSQCGISHGVDVSEIRIGFGPNSTITTLNLANEWLKNNNVTIIYELSTVEELELTETQIKAFRSLRTFDNITNIYTSDYAYFDLEYFNNNPISKTLSEIVDKIYNI